MIEFEEIILKCKEGDSSAQKIIYDNFASKMYAVCLRYVSNKYDAQDVLQDGFLKIFQSISDYNFSGSFEGWLRRIFVNTAIDFLKNKKKLSCDDYSENYDYYESESLSLAEQVDAFELLGMLTELPHKYRTVFNLYVIEGMSHEEISKILKISAGTSRSNLTRARNLLKNIFLSKQQAVSDKL